MKAYEWKASRLEMPKFDSGIAVGKKLFSEPYLYARMPCKKCLTIALECFHVGDLCQYCAEEQLNEMYSKSDKG